MKTSKQWVNLCSLARVFVPVDSFKSICVIVNSKGYDQTVLQIRGSNREWSQHNSDVGMDKMLKFLCDRQGPVRRAILYTDRSCLFSSFQ